MNKLLILVSVALLIAACNTTSKTNSDMQENQEMKEKVEEYAPFALTTDLNTFQKKKSKCLPLLFKAADLMNEIFWIEAFGDKDSLFSEDMGKYTKAFLKINYGPWERLNNNKPFLPGYGEKPAGANFYPKDMTKEEFEAWDENQKPASIH